MNDMLHLPSLSVLRSFEAAAKHQSYTQAAEELRVTQGAISRQVRELETIVGVTLFRKAGRGVALTEAGRNLAARLQGDLDRLRQTVAYASAAGDGARTLSIAVLPTFGARWLAPRLPRFAARQPRAQLAFHSRGEPFDLAREGIDLAIHFGSADWVGGTLTPLCPEDLVAVASPLLADRYEVERPEDSLRLPLLHLSSRATAWQDYFSGLGLVPDGALQGALFDQFSTMIAAATHGLGAAIVPTYLIESELAQGTLIILGQPAGSEGMYYVVRPRDVENPLAESFAAWVCEEAQASSLRRLQRQGG